jgi:hypothetical protein
MKQAQLEYTEGRTSRAEYQKQRQSAIDALQKDLSSLQKSRDDLRKGAITRMDAADRFNASQVNAARRTYSTQSMAAQRFSEAERKIKEGSGLDKNAEQSLYNVIAQAASSEPPVTDPLSEGGPRRRMTYDEKASNAIDAAVRDHERYPELANIDRKVLQDAGSRMLSRFQEFQMDPEYRQYRDDEVKRELRRQRLGDSSLPPIGDDEDLEDLLLDGEDTPSDVRSGVRPVGYRAQQVTPDISGELGELDRISAREAAIMKDIEKLQTEMSEYKMDDFDLIDRAREIWREKFGRPPSKNESRSFLNIVKSGRPPSKSMVGEDVMGVAGSKEELDQRLDQLGVKRTPPSPDVPIQPETSEDFDQMIGGFTEDLSGRPIIQRAEQVDPSIDEQVELRRQLESPVGSSERVLRGLRDRELGGVPMTADPPPYSAIPDIGPIRRSQVPIVKQPTGSVLNMDELMGTEPIVPSQPTQQELQKQFFQPDKGVPFTDEEPDVYQKAEEKFKSGSIEISPKDKLVIEKVVDLWKAKGKVQSFESLVETIEKAFEDKPMDKLASTLAYFMKAYSKTV